ncbi:MAG: cyclase family protein [Rhodospirillaceae bacterium]|nr:cyclase family protein [Rhodospirillaceae bacterium]MDD9999222.1 cyclase family protein [Rhodospirillaceae bacterium]MDE0362187.1 cyclase family protein [Rhodospirillaceae bacterium]
MTSEIIDISQAIRPGIPVWPGDTRFSIDEVRSISEDRPVRVSRLTMSTHTGTHADAHLYYHAKGIDSASRDLAPYIGHCAVIQDNGSPSCGSPA